MEKRIELLDDHLLSHDLEKEVGLLTEDEFSDKLCTQVKLRKALKS